MGAGGGVGAGESNGGKVGQLQLNNNKKMHTERNSYI